MPTGDVTREARTREARTRAAQRRRPELATFLRSRRARVTPADVGMPPGFRRRTPGLRREEVAQLSGVGVTWYTWLEQGRPINASAQVLDAVARTLRLDPPEREHLYRLAAVPFDPGPEPPVQRVGPEVQLVLDALDPHPGAVYNSRYDVLATNAAYRDMYALPAMRGTGVPNVLWSLFTGPAETCPLVYRERELPVMVATLRSNYGRHVGEPSWENFVRALSAASDCFARLWASGEVIPPGPRVKAFRQESVGELRMTAVSLSIDGLPECRIVTYTPDDEETRAKIALLRDRRERLWPPTQEAADAFARGWNSENPAPWGDGILLTDP
ncbi:helix-turn-helix domain-containing protein [Streptomyces seoulensis]|nr:helix-turn-helix domain-containing protein [Streptomyces seoulensis]